MNKWILVAAVGWLLWKASKKKNAPMLVTQSPPIASEKETAVS